MSTMLLRSTKWLIFGQVIARLHARLIFAANCTLSQSNCSGTKQSETMLPLVSSFSPLLRQASSPLAYQSTRV
jgi:hypothetical protein